MLAEIPQFTGSTSLDLLLHIRRLILEEPKRILMETWGERLRGTDLDAYQREEFADAYYGREFPACGTVGCISGWMDFSMGNLRAVPLGGYKYLPNSLKSEARALFNGVDVIDMDGETVEFDPYPFPNPKLPAGIYAREVIKNIDKFIERNREALAAHVIR